jgi:ABC-type multidrug transport system ATPase subunit
LAEGKPGQGAFGERLIVQEQSWTILKEYKRDRIILITTHYMDEADILGDRIGTMF